MLNQPARRSLLALAGATAGLASLAAGSTAAAAQADLEPDAEQRSWLPPDSQPPAPAPDSHGTCTTFRDFLPDHPINVPVPTTGSGNGHCILVQGNRGAGVKILQSAIFNCYPNLRGVLGPVDGIYGPGTRDAVTFVQAIEGVTADGVYGFNTKNAMLWPGYDSNDKLVGCLPLV
jgi:peptidoglycan hydrolase-like protein with peptidoglycan-binding domain